MTDPTSRGFLIYYAHVLLRCAARIEWEEDQMASHIVDICQQTMLGNRAALSSAIGDEFSGWVEVVEEGK